jgi:hypothetical protein
MKKKQSEDGAGAPIPRRRFIRVLAAGGAALVAQSLPAPAVAAGRAAKPPRPRPEKGPAPALLREIENQKKSLAETLKTIRDYPLPAGSEPAVVFRARPRAARREGR